jgi:glycosyltransferase involved in cell wall biosynthesis
MFFSIVIPTYNRAHLLEKTIRTVADQQFKDFELIVVDDGSTDHTETIVRGLIASLSIPIHYIRQINSERAVARNNGLKQAIGEYVLFFDSDDTLYVDHLRVAKDYIEAHDQPEFLHLRYDLKNKDEKVTQLGPEFKSPPNKHLIRGNFLSCNGVFVRRDIALKNQFNEDRRLSAMEDWELWLRLASQYTLHYVNTVTSSIINHDERSVVMTQETVLVNRVKLLMTYVKTNPQVMSYYKKDLRKFEASCLSYIALHLSLTGRYKGATIKYLVLCIFKFPATLFQRRFFATLKHLF